jgi:AAA15 family ATPase/GTPase
MYKSFRIANFRCFTKLEFGPLQQVNLIAGKNNVGKTALLEALWIHHGYQNPELGVRVDAFRGLATFKVEELMSSLFRGFDDRAEITIDSTDSRGRKASLKIAKQKRATTTRPIVLDEYRPSPEDRLGPKNGELTATESTDISRPEVTFQFKTQKRQPIKSRAYVDKDNLKFEQATRLDDTRGIYLASNYLENLNALAERLGNLQLSKTEDTVTEILRIVEPDLNKLIVRFVAGVPVIYGDVGLKQMIPLPLMGGGMDRLLRIALAITDVRKGIVLIDEVENGLHHTAMKRVWKAVAALARQFSVQVFATTHSRECIVAAHESFSEDAKYDFVLHRLDRIAGDVGTVAYDQEALDAAIKSEFEVR